MSEMKTYNSPFISYKKTTENYYNHDKEYFKKYFRENPDFLQELIVELRSEKIKKIKNINGNPF